MPEPLRTVVHSNGTVQRIFATWVETDIPGLQTLYACPMAEQEGLAAEFGYEDADGLTRDHDFLHAWLTDTLGLPASYSLTCAAGGTVDAELATAEEGAVLALQRFIRLAGIDPASLA